MRLKFDYVLGTLPPCPSTFSKCGREEYKVKFCKNLNIVHVDLPYSLLRHKIYLL